MTAEQACHQAQPGSGVGRHQPRPARPAYRARREERAAPTDRATARRWAKGWTTERGHAVCGHAESDARPAGLSTAFHLDTVRRRNGTREPGRWDGVRAPQHPLEHRRCHSAARKTRRPPPAAALRAAAR